MTDAFPIGEPLPVGSKDRNSTAWLGALCLIATEGSLFAYLLFSYAYAASQHGAGWLPTPYPSFKYSLLGTIILLLSSVAVWWGERGVKRGRRLQHLGGLAIAVALGLLFLVVQLFEWKSKTFSLSSSGYGSFFFTITGFHMAHVIVGVTALAAVLGWAVAGYFGPRRYAHVMIASIYWHFVDAVWLAVFFTFYVAPYLWSVT
jgi:cytochrome c oxidase subunit 3